MYPHPGKGQENLAKLPIGAILAMQENPRKAAAGRKGGTVTLERYGRDQMAAWGKLGGRPRSMTYDDIRQQQRLEQRNNNEEGEGLPGKVSELKRLYKLRGRSSPSPDIEPAGMAQTTPEPALPERVQS